MSSKVEICNFGLNYIGDGNSIFSLDEDSVEAIACNRVFNHCVKVVLEAQPWSFARLVKELALLSDEENIHPFSYAYALPSDFIRLNNIVNTTTYETYAESYKSVPYEVRRNTAGTGKILVTNLENPLIKYNATTSNTELYSGIFVDTLAWYIAFSVAPVLTKDENIRNLCFNGYKQALQSAITFDVAQDNFVNVQDNRYADAHR